MVASVQRLSVKQETEDMTRAFKDFVTDVGSSMKDVSASATKSVKSITPSTVRKKMERYSESMSSGSLGFSSSGGGTGTTAAGSGSGGITNATSPRSPSRKLLDSLQCGSLADTLECSARGGKGPNATLMDWTTSVETSKRNGSDWTIQVYDGKESVVYHVHTVALSYGPRSSQYFARLFEKKRMAGMTTVASGGGTPVSVAKRIKPGGALEKGVGSSGSGWGAALPPDDGVTEVYLPAPSAAVFPLLLDYIYHDRFTIDTPTAPALRHLSKHFSIQAMFERVGKFIKRDLSVETAPEYCANADAILDKDLLDAALKKCAENMFTVEVEKLPPKLMSELVSSRHVTSPKGGRSPIGSEALSEVVCRYVRKRRDGERLGDEAFYWLTQPRVLPTVAPSEAVFLLSFGQKYPAVLHEGGDVSLKSRCLDALGRDWDAGLGDAVEASAIEREGRRDMSVPSPLGIGGDVDDGGLYHKAADGDGDGEDPKDKAKADTAMRYRNLPLEVRVELLEMALLTAKKERHATAKLMTMTSSPSREITPSTLRRSPRSGQHSQSGSFGERFDI